MNLSSISRRYLALALLFASPFVRGQAPPVDPPPVEPPEPDVPTGLREVELPEPPAVPKILSFGGEGDAAHWPIELRRAGQQAQRAMKDVERQISGLRFGYSGPEARRLLVIPNEDATEDAVVESRNDLAVMATILSRAAHPEKPRRGDMLFEIDGWRAGNGRELEALMLDGYGAVFLLGVDYPLVKPPSGTEAKSEPKSKADNTWERTRREVLGRNDPDDAADDTDGDDDSTARKFDSEQVNALQQRLIEALRHAGNLRGLTPDNWIVVQVTAQAPPGMSADNALVGPGGGRVVFHRREQRGTSVLTLRVKKSAVDAFAANRMKLEEFSQAVQVSRRLEKAPTPRQ
ncbi:MAG TPA: hypothetical protein PLX89_12480 [Verrucomicrobiota bacterium]|nr:hypothetical protein [Verrucomicrobiota bacterium]